MSLSQTEEDDIRMESEGWSNEMSERAPQEHLQQSGVESMDHHLVEFSETLRTVAKAMRRVAEGKALAQEEAAEWKRKYELERRRNSLLEKKGQESTDVKQPKEFLQHPEKGLSTQDQNGILQGKYRIYSEEVLQRHSSKFDLGTSAKPHTGKSLFTLSWGNADKNTRHKHDVVSFERGNITTAVRSSKQITLEWDSLPQSVIILTKPNSTSVRETCKDMVRWLKEEKKLNIFVEIRVKEELLEESQYFNFVQTWEKDEVLHLHTKVDLVITLGGDGTVLWAASMFKGPVPPVVPFSLGSLGFMTPFQSELFKEYLQKVMAGPLSITLRHRLQCRIIRDESKDDRPVEEPILVLNDVSIDRGMSSFLTNLECYCDNSFVTCVQGDGLILSTTSGSTAYSLAAGGSMVHPEVPGILFTPICPHSLSFRPLILPEYVILRVQVPYNSRGKAWASFDGKDRKQLNAGDALLCSMAPWPVPTVCEVDSTHDFLRSVCDGLHWNLRKKQSFDGIREI